MNRDCACLPIAREKAELAVLSKGTHPDLKAMLDERENYFATTAVFVSRRDINAMQDQIKAIETVANMPAWQEEIFDFEPDELHLAQPGTKGVFMGYDFHMTENGPRLIEVNTNAGGAFIVDALQDVVGQPSQAQLFADMFRREWQAAGRDGQLGFIAIIDNKPSAQFHYPDMCLAVETLQRHGFDAVIAGPAELALSDGVLSIGGKQIDMVYNRLTDFDLTAPENAVLRRALLEDAAVISPAPRHHALLADKSNLTILSDPDKLANLGVQQSVRDVLAAIPKTLEVTLDRLEELWRDRRKYFFKPNAGFGSRAAYHGAKLTKRVWAHISKGGYVAQEFIQPPRRVITQGGKPHGLKFDVRVYTYDGQALLNMARIYEGQTTNLRTQGGGLAPVIIIDE